LAGGYSDPMQLTIDIHLQTLAVSDAVFGGWCQKFFSVTIV
jgi:hypothetical protein